MLNDQVLWEGSDNASFLAIGGQPSKGNSVKAGEQNTLWHFHPSLPSSGSWDTVPNRPGSGIPTARPAQGLADGRQGRGFWLGGHQEDVPSNCQKGCVAPAEPGLLMYDMNANTWSNKPFSPVSSEAAQGGAMRFIPEFGKKKGVLVVMGLQPSAGTTTNVSGAPVSFDTLLVYDISADAWYQQTTTGVTPSARANFCTTGLWSKDGSYEIFVYGGVGSDGKDASHDSDVYILTLPGFAWFKANATANAVKASPRALHTCEVVGNSQMLSIGGVDPGASSFPDLTTVDPYHNALGVFDLINWNWRAGYDPHLDDYTRNKAVAEWYTRDNAYDNIRWNDPALKDIFLPSASTSASSSSTRAAGLLPRL